jgi:hypothetical protein
VNEEEYVVMKRSTLFRRAVAFMLGRLDVFIVRQVSVSGTHELKDELNLSTLSKAQRRLN